jgi:hypothetical protein
MLYIIFAIICFHQLEVIILLIKKKKMFSPNVFTHAHILYITHMLVPLGNVDNVDGLAGILGCGVSSLP